MTSSVPFNSLPPSAFTPIMRTIGTTSSNPIRLRKGFHTRRDSADSLHWEVTRLHLNPSSRVSGWSTNSLLGEGTYGQVYLVQHTATGTEYAMKVVPIDRPMPAVICKGLINELLALEKMSNSRHAVPFVLKPSSDSPARRWAWQSTQGYLHILTEYCPGGDLRDYKGQLSAATLRLVLAELVIAIDNLHKMGIVHHDIKPDNVLVDMKGHCLLADYGGAKFLSDDGTVNLNIEEDVMSTLPYAAPEILSEDCDPDGMKYYDEAVDWWALGATILTLVTGEEYFYGSTIDNLCDNIPRLLEQVRSTLENYHCCPELIDFVESLLQPDPLMRLRGSAVREHEYFDKLPCSWGSLASRSSKVAPPFVISDEDRRQGMTAWPHQFHSLVSGGNQTDIYFVDELHKQGLGLEVDDDFEVPV